MRYNAFISYKHSKKDMYVAKQVHKKLETFKIPFSVRKKFGKKKIERVFRDEEELPIGSDLGDNIAAALQESEFLVVICSKESKQSYWVNQEIETFIKLKGHKNILAVLLDGEPHESFPEKLLCDEEGNPIEPLAADVRGATLKQIKKKMKTEIVRLAAQIIGCSYDELRQRHRERRMRKVITATAIVAMLAISFGVYSVYNYLTIKKNYEAKLINQSKYLADTSSILLENGDRINAGLVALEALPGENNNRPLVSAAQLALSQALYAYSDGNTLLKDRLLKHDLPVDNIRYSNDGKILATIDQGDNVYVWDISEGKLLIKIEPSLDEDGYYEDIYEAVITDNKNVVIVASDSIKCMDFEGEIIWSEETKEGYLDCFIDDSNELIAGISSDIVEVWDISEGEIIASMVNTEEDCTFTSTGAFDMYGKKIAVACYMDATDSGTGKVYTMSLEDSEINVINTKKEYVMNLCFSTDKDITIMSRMVYDTVINVEHYNSDTGALIWEDEFEKSAYEISISDNIIKSRSYNNGDQHDEVIISLNNSIYVYNENTGDLITDINVPQGISVVLLSTGSGVGYIVDDNGSLIFYNLSTGELYPNLVVDINRSVNQVIIKNGVLAARIYSSADVIIMKYIEGYGIETIEEYDEVIFEMEYSPDEGVYAVEHSRYDFYSTKSNKLISSYELEDSYADKTCFIDNETYAVFLQDGEVDYIDVKSGDIDTFKISKNDDLYSWSLSENQKFAVAYSNNNYYLLDLESKDIEIKGKLKDEIIDAVISNTGNVICFIDENKNLVAVTVQDEKETEFELTEFNNIAISADGQYLAGSCLDNKIRIYDINTKEVMNEFYFVGNYNNYISFIPNDDKLVVQGDTYFIGIYDMNVNEYIYISDEQYNDIQKTVVDDDSIAIVTPVEMVIINRKDYEPMAIVNNGLSYMPKSGYVFTKSLETLYRFPYMDLELLKKQAKEEFSGHTLTKLERIQYNID